MPLWFGMIGFHALVCYYANTMSGKRFGIRLDGAAVQQLKVRSAAEGRSVNDIATAAIREYSNAHPVSRAQMLEMVRAIGVEDAPLLEVLAKA